MHRPRAPPRAEKAEKPSCSALAVEPNRGGTEVRVLGARHRLERAGGRGGVAALWQARDLVLHRTVAVKQLVPELDVRTLGTAATGTAA